MKVTATFGGFLMFGVITVFFQARPVDELRQKLRMRGLRCHLMYCRNSTRLQVIPLLASRSQALRYASLIFE